MEKSGVNIVNIIEKNSKLRWIDFLYPYHLFLDSGEKIVMQNGKEYVFPNTISLYYRKRRSLVWLKLYYFYKIAIIATALFKRM